MKELRQPKSPKDVSEWIAGGGTKEDLWRLIDASPEYGAKKDISSTKDDVEPAMEPSQPFPIAAVPEPLRTLIAEAAETIGCDLSMVALPLLTAAGAAIGATRVLRFKRRWQVFAVIWTAVIGKSGCGKSPAMNLALEVVRNRQTIANHQWEMAMQEYRDLVEENRGKKGEKPKIEVPVEETFLVRDVTIEALAMVLKNAPRGVLAEFDELATWFGSFERYKGGGTTTDAPHWLSLYDGGVLSIHRKTGDVRRIFIPRAIVPVTGGIQPHRLPEVVTKGLTDAGLTPRFLFSYPPSEIADDFDEDVSDESISAVDDLFGELFSLDFYGTGDDGCPIPEVVELDPEARRICKSFHRRMTDAMRRETGALTPVWSKYRDVALRLALIVHCVRGAVGVDPPASPRRVDADSMRSSVALMDWFCNQARRVYSLLSGVDSEPDAGGLVDFVRRQGGRVKARDVYKRQIGGIKDEPGATAALNQLREAGLGDWIDQPPGPKGGRPTRWFVLKDETDTTKTPEIARENEGSVPTAEGSVLDDSAQADGPVPDTTPPSPDETSPDSVEKEGSGCVGSVSEDFPEDEWEAA